MRALVLGGAGFIGLHLTRRLLADGFTVTIVDDFSRGTDDHEVRDVAAAAEVRTADLTRPDSYDRYDRSFRPCLRPRRCGGRR